MSNKHRVSFVAEKKVAEPVRVVFETKSGKEVSFPAHKEVKEPVKVTFLAKNK